MLIRHDLPLEDEMDSLGPKPRMLGIDGKPKKRRAAPERSVQVTLRRYLLQVLPQCEVVAIRNEAQPASTNPKSRARFHAARKAMGGLWGAPDVMVILPGRIFFVECKAPGGAVSFRQHELHERWRSKGHVVIVADAVESLRYGLRQAGIITLDGSSDARPAKVRVEAA